jgi:hypothetical protein
MRARDYPAASGTAHVADIFISYTSSDREWAFWIAKELEALGHTPHVHEWEVKGGGDIPAWMERRQQEADHTLCVVSKAYLVAPFSSWERRAAQWAAAEKRPNFALPVFVEDCEAPLQLALLKRCDLHGIGEDEARVRLAAFLAPAGKPAGPTPFPGVAGANAATSDSTSESEVREVATFPGPRLALSNVPITVPLHFLGRDAALAAIETALARTDGRVAITALHGLRGVGKTSGSAGSPPTKKRSPLSPP